MKLNTFAEICNNLPKKHKIEDYIETFKNAEIEFLIRQMCSTYEGMYQYRSYLEYIQKETGLIPCFNPVHNIECDIYDYNPETQLESNKPCNCGISQEIGKIKNIFETWSIVK